MSTLEERLYNDARLCPGCGNVPTQKIMAKIFEGHCGGWDKKPRLEEVETCCNFLFVELGISDPHTIAVKALR